MTAGITGRPLAGTKVALAPATLAGLLGVALLTGGLFGAAITSELGSLSSSRPIALVEAATTPHVGDHVGLTERLFAPVQSAARVGDHVGLTERLFPPVQSAARVGDHVGLTERLFPPAQGVARVGDHVGLTERLFRSERLFR